MRSSFSSAPIRASKGGIVSAVSSTPTPDRKPKPHPSEFTSNPEITGMTDQTIDTAGDQPVSRLDGDKSTETIAQHKDWPEPQCATGCEKHDADPANSIAVYRPELLSVGTGGKYAPNSPTTAKAAKTQRLPRSSRTLVLRFPPAKNDAPANMPSTTASAISAGCEKNVARPPPPIMASAR